MHIVLCGNAAHADDSVVFGVAGNLELHQILEQGLAVRGLQLSEALRILGFQRTENLSVIADLISTEGVHGSIPGNVRQEQGGGNGLPAGLFRWLHQHLLSQSKNELGHFLHSTGRVEIHPRRGKAIK
jgi:hypothetical protein